MFANIIKSTYSTVQVAHRTLSASFYSSFTRFKSNCVAHTGAAVQIIRQQTTNANQSTTTEVTHALSENDVVSPTFINRNPRNLEMMSIARKNRGWKYQYPSLHYYHRLVFEHSHRHTKAYVEHISGKQVVSASTHERAISNFLYRANDVSAAENIGHVIAQRCKESGITSVKLLIPTDEQFSERFTSFYKAVEDAGISLREPPFVVKEYEPGIDYSNEEEVNNLRTRQASARFGGPESFNVRQTKNARRIWKSKPWRHYNINYNKGHIMQGRLLGMNKIFHAYRKGAWKKW